MIMKKEFLDWLEKADEDIWASMYNFSIITFCSLKFTDRVKTAFEIILGRKFSIWISRNQEKDKNEKDNN